jgi:dienelactone hydrolase
MRLLLSAGMLLAFFFTSARAAPLTLQQAIAPSSVSQISLSPDGKHLAMVVASMNGHGLHVYDTTDDMQGKTLVIGRFVTEGGWSFFKSPRAVSWAGNDLLAVDYGIEAESIDLNGKKVADLGEQIIGPAERERPDSPWLLVYTDVKSGDIGKVNARTGEMKLFSYPRGKAINWAFDRSGELRAVTLLNSEFWNDVTTVTNWYLPQAYGEWEKLAEFSVKDDYWVPIFVPDEPHTLVVSSRIGRDTYAVFKYDTERRAMGKMIAGHPTQDILGARGLDPQAFERVTTRGLRIEQMWLDAAWAQVQANVDVTLPNRFNTLSGNPRGKVLVYSQGDIDPGEWHLLDMEKVTLKTLAQRLPETAGVTMRPMEILHYAADDGLDVPAFLTRPADGARNTPLVVLIHAGPWERDYWGWNQEVQVLAANGYAVFQPQFRGSSGFGKRFEQAGYGQWGLAMQDDISAGVRHLIQQGVVDPRRICIVGASYGGYAALWGLVKTPELYQCGVSFAGVTDIGHMARDGSDRNGNKIARELSLMQIGDTRAEQGKFDQVSPLKHASRIKAPVLLMHGEEDVRVPISHGGKMKQALEASGKQVEWINFPHAGHGLHSSYDSRRYYEALLAFLNKHTGTSGP